MSFSYGSKSRHRGTGRHFKLFSDELPRIEFDKASFEEFNNAANEKRRSKGKRRSFRDSNHDRFSLPSLGTPEWDGLSEAEKIRPQSYSPFNPLNPNFAKIHQKIQRRHTLKETKVNEWNPKHEDTFRIRQNDSVDKEDYTNAWNEKVRKSKSEHDRDKKNTPEHDKEIKEELNTSAEYVDKVIVDKPPVPKKKSLFKELLDASAKENARMNRIKEGLKFNASSMHRHHSMKPYRVSSISQDKLQNETKVDTNGYKEEHSVPEVISETAEQTKPGILKHGVRVRESNVFKASTKRDFPVKPRLIHQEDLPVFGKETANGTKSPGDEVRVSVYADTPLNRLVDMMFVPLPSTKPKDKRKKVNFHDHVDIKERTAMSELIEGDNENADGIIAETETTDKTNDSDKKNVTAGQHRNSVQIRRRNNVRHKDISKPFDKHIVTIKHKQTSGDTQSLFNEKFVHVSKRNEYERQHDNVKQDYIDTILLSSKPVGNKANELMPKPLWKEAKPAVSEVLIHEPDPVDIIAKVNSPIEPEVTKISSNNAGKLDSRLHGHLSLITFPNSQIALNNDRSLRSPPRSPARSPPRSPPKSPDIDSISEFTAFFDEDLDLDDLPEEIDRSMLGEDLIKAYRLWDRKRKAFPGGLRKIEAPSDRHESSHPKQYGNVKTYKITNPRLDKPPIAPTHNKTSHNSVLMDWV